MSDFSSFLSETELHGLVDGHIANGRRGDLLRRAAASPSDRERIASWQDQNDLIRATFRSVEREPVPPTLDLRTPARFQSVPPAEVATAVVPGTVAVAGRPEPRRRVVGTLFTTLIVAGGLVGAWAIGESHGRPVAGAPIEDDLSRRAVVALGADPGGAATTEAVSMPTTSIPDLSAAGFWLSRAELQRREPVSLVFHYRNAASERIAIGVARTNAEPAAQGDDVVVWRKGTRAYAVTGTLRRDRLRSIAAALRGRVLAE